jgi:phage shock protein A
MKVKKKRAVNPDIPRPNLFTHEKQIKDMASANAQLVAQVQELHQQVQRLERKIKAQSDYLNTLHQRVILKK